MDDRIVDALMRDHGFSGKHAVLVARHFVVEMTCTLEPIHVGQFNRNYQPLCTINVNRHARVLTGTVHPELMDVTREVRDLILDLQSTEKDNE